MQVEGHLMLTSVLVLSLITRTLWISCLFFFRREFPALGNIMLALYLQKFLLWPLSHLFHM